MAGRHSLYAERAIHASLRYRIFPCLTSVNAGPAFAAATTEQRVFSFCPVFASCRSSRVSSAAGSGSVDCEERRPFFEQTTDDVTAAVRVINDDMRRVSFQAQLSLPRLPVGRLAAVSAAAVFTRDDFFVTCNTVSLGCSRYVCCRGRVPWAGAESEEGPD